MYFFNEKYRLEFTSFLFQCDSPFQVERDRIIYKLNY